MSKQIDQSRQEFENWIKDNHPEASEMAEYAMWLVWRASRDNYLQAWTKCKQQLPPQDVGVLLKTHDCMVVGYRDRHDDFYESAPYVKEAFGGGIDPLIDVEVIEWMFLPEVIE